MTVRRSRRHVTLASLSLLIAMGCGGGDGTGSTATTDHDSYSHEDLVRLFEYDQSAPLDLQYVATRTEAEAIVHDIYYTSPKGGVVTAHLVEPLGNGPFAGAIFLHWGEGDRGQYLGEATQLAGRGVVSLLMNAPWNCPGYSMGLPDDMYIRQVVDARRALDVLASLPHVDSARLGYVGHSNGAIWGGVLAGVESRIGTYVLTAGYGRPSRYYPDNLIPTARLDAIHYIGHAAPASLFFQFGTLDINIPEEAALEFYEAGSEPKRMVWYEADHAMRSDQARLDRVEWLTQQLGLAQPPPQ